MEKKLFLVIENNIQKEIQSNVNLNKSSTIIKRNLKFTDFSSCLDLKKIKLPLFYKLFGSSKELNDYLKSIQKRKNFLPVFIKFKYLIFKSPNSLNKYVVNHEEVVNKFRLLNTNYMKLILVLKQLKKSLS